MCCRHVCPYHASRDVLNEGAALVFVTYSQLLDPPVRSANGLDDLLQGAVLVFDEVLHHLFGQQNTEQSMPPCRLLSHWCYAMTCHPSLDAIPCMNWQMHFAGCWCCVQRYNLACRLS